MADRGPRPGVPPKSGAGDAAIGLRSSSTIVGLSFGTIAATATGYGGSVPIAGKVQLEGAYFVCPVLPDAGVLHYAQLGIASDVPTTQAEVDGAEQLFPRASNVVGEASTILLGGLGEDVFLPLSTVVVMNGRRFIGRATNKSTVAPGGFYVALLMHRVYGGSVAGDPAFLSGEEVIER